MTSDVNLDFLSPSISENIGGRASSLSYSIAGDEIGGSNRLEVSDLTITLYPKRGSALSCRYNVDVLESIAIDEGDGVKGSFRLKNLLFLTKANTKIGVKFYIGRYHHAQNILNTADDIYDAASKLLELGYDEDEVSV